MASKKKVLAPETDRPPIQSALAFTVELATAVELAAWLAKGLDPRRLSDEAWAQLLGQALPRMSEILACPDVWSQGGCRFENDPSDTRAVLALSATGREALALPGTLGQEACRRFAGSFADPEALAAARAALDKNRGVEGGAIGVIGFFASEFIDSIQRVENPAVLRPWSQLAFEHALQTHREYFLWRILAKCARLGLPLDSCDAKTADRVARAAAKIAVKSPDWASELAVAEQMALFAATRAAALSESTASFGAADGALSAEASRAKRL